MKVFSEGVKLHPFTTNFVIAAVAAGRYLQSKETKLVHYQSSSIEAPPHQSAPFLENILWIYALFRTHQKEQITEAKTLLSRILHFQTPSGGFPAYLHEYPFTGSREKNQKILLTLTLLYKHYSAVIESPLKESLLKACESLYLFCKQQAKNPLEVYWISTCGYFLHKEERPKINFTPKGRSGISDFLLFAQFFPEPVSVPWSEQLDLYIGDPVGEFYEGKERQILPVDLFFATNAPEKCTQIPVSFMGALIHYKPEVLFLSREEGGLYQNSQSSRGLLTFKDHYDPDREDLPGGSHLIRYIFQNETLVFLESKHLVNMELKGDTLTADITITGPYEESDPIELELFATHNPATPVVSEDSRALATFALNEPIYLTVGESKLKLLFESIGENARFSGHIFLGNRPGQIAKEAKRDFAFYDKVIALRTVFRKESVTVRMRLTGFSS